MQTASAALEATINTLTGLTYIDSLVSGATAQGLTYISVDQKFISATMITSLESSGYVVTEHILDGNTAYKRYIISWG